MLIENLQQKSVLGVITMFAEKDTYAVGTSVM